MDGNLIEFAAPGGLATARLFKPATATSKAGIILYMDVFGLRASLASMAARLAGEGYTVLLPDLYYRQPDHGSFDPNTAFKEEASNDRLRKLRAETPISATQADTDAFIEALTENGATGPVGTVGYCMGGARALVAAATAPGRIRAAASFHGGNLANDDADSPHLLASHIKARVYVGSASVDKSFPPEQVARLAGALTEAQVDYAMENYVGMAHGWTVPDHSVYDPAGAERHWTRLTGLFRETLGTSH
ncbi:dienelactone hydrolase family protein [Mesorhizobium sp. CAU 1741]|uniref:dienelactone hydrolase family protein n=1 Tax=Mesorhizobium sp. CAU 1741 TaxID=3140366 RepID=UPI00325B3E84